MDFTTEEHIAQLIFRYIQGCIPEEGLEELNTWRSASARHEALFQRMTSQKYLEESISRFVKTPAEKQANRKRLYRQMQPAKRALWQRPWVYAATIAVFFTIGGILLYPSPKDRRQPEILVSGRQGPVSQPVLILPNGEQINLKDESQAISGDLFTVTGDSLSYEAIPVSLDTPVYHTLRIPYGSEYLLTLSDHSFVHLNAGSELVYPVRFTGKQRKVYLKGEAYFKIRKDSIHPFVVLADQMEVKVTGTSFGIRAYPDENDIRTTLESGSVTVSGKTCHAALSTGKQAIFNKQNPALIVQEVNTDLYLGWKDGRLVYDNCPLEEILRDLGKWYVFDVIYKKQELRFHQFSLNMKRHGTIQGVLELLGNADDIHFEIKGHTVIVE